MKPCAGRIAAFLAALLLLPAYDVWPQALESPQTSEPMAPPLYGTGVVLSVERPGARPAHAARVPLEDFAGRAERVRVLITQTPREEESTLPLALSEGRTVTVKNYISDNPVFDIPVAPGATVLLAFERHPAGGWEIHIADRNRLPALTLLFCLTLLGLLFAGGRAILPGLLLIGALAVLLEVSAIPRLMTGESPMVWAGLFCALLIGVGAVIFSREKRHAPAIIAACLGGLGLAWAALATCSVLAPLSGLGGEQAMGLWQEYPEIRFQELLWASVLLAHGGLALHQAVHTVNTLPASRAPGLSRDAAAAGRRVFATLAPGIVLLYLGLFLPRLFFNLYVPLEKALNGEDLTSLAAGLLSSLFGLACQVPLLAWLLRLGSSASEGDRGEEPTRNASDAGI